MSRFMDQRGDHWTLTVTVHEAKRVRADVGFDLLADDFAATVSRLASDPVTLVDVLWTIVREQAGGRDIGEVEFAKRMYGESIETAFNALVDALLDFCPSPRVRAARRALMDASQRAADRALDLTEQRIEELRSDASITAIAEMVARSGSSSTSGQASQDSTPDP